jgi:hypothetical protein
MDMEPQGRDGGSGMAGAERLAPIEKPSDKVREA